MRCEGVVDPIHRAHERFPLGYQFSQITCTSACSVNATDASQ